VSSPEAALLPALPDADALQEAEQDA
jgi:hypothetical protein